MNVGFGSVGDAKSVCKSESRCTVDINIKCNVSSQPKLNALRAEGLLFVLFFRLFSLRCRHSSVFTRLRLTCYQTPHTLSVQDFQATRLRF
jgi:hypothetical protein